MPKPPPKKRPPTLRELLERDAKYPLQNIGITDDFNKSPVENGMSDIQDETTQQELILRAKREYENMQSRKIPTGPPQEFNPNEIPKPISINPLVLLAKILTSSAPAGIRQDTELALVREGDDNRSRNKFINEMARGFKPQYAPIDNLADRLGARTNYGRNTPQEVYGMTALGNGPAYPRQGMMSKAMGVTNKKAGK